MELFMDTFSELKPLSAREAIRSLYGRHIIAITNDRRIEERRQYGQLFGLPFIDEYVDQDIDILNRSVSRLPIPLSPDHRIWSYVTNSQQISDLLSAIDLYKTDRPAFDVKFSQIEASIILDALEKAENGDVASLIDALKSKRDDLEQAGSDLRTLLDLSSKVFKVSKPDIGFAAALAYVIGSLNDRHEDVTIYPLSSLEIIPDERSLNELHAIRREMVEISDEAQELFGFSLIQFSYSALGGVRRALDESSPSELTNALKNIGIFYGEHDINDVLRVIRPYCIAQKRYTNLVSAYGPWSITETVIPPYLHLRDLFKLSTNDNFQYWSHLSALAVLDRESNPEDLLNAVIGPRTTTLLAEKALNGAMRPLTSLMEDIEKAANEVDTTTSSVALIEGEIASTNELAHLLRNDPLRHLARWDVQTTDELADLERHAEWLKAVTELPLTGEGVSLLLQNKGLIPLSELSEGGDKTETSHSLVTASSETQETSRSFDPIEMPQSEADVACPGTDAEIETDLAELELDENLVQAFENEFADIITDEIEVRPIDGLKIFKGDYDALLSSLPGEQRRSLASWRENWQATAPALNLLRSFIDFEEPAEGAPFTTGSWAFHKMCVEKAVKRFHDLDAGTKEALVDAAVFLSNETFKGSIPDLPETVLDAPEELRHLSPAIVGLVKGMAEEGAFALDAALLLDQSNENVAVDLLNTICKMAPELVAFWLLTDKVSG